jgi:hypothetical protein
MHNHLRDRHKQWIMKDWHVMCEEVHSQHYSERRRTPRGEKIAMITSENPGLPVPQFDRDAVVRVTMLVGLPYAVLCDAIFSDPIMWEGLSRLFWTIPIRK